MNDPKYNFQDGRIYNAASGEIIPYDEPCMVFRARDEHAIAAITGYLVALFFDSSVKDEHKQAVFERLTAFGNFKIQHPDRMKTPDTDLNPKVED